MPCRPQIWKIICLSVCDEDFCGNFDPMVVDDDGEVEDDGEAEDDGEVEDVGEVDDDGKVDNLAFLNVSCCSSY